MVCKRAEIDQRNSRETMVSKDENRRSEYELWVHQYGTDVYRCALRLCGQQDSAEELAQETFFHAWRGMDSLRDPERAKFWLLGILRRRYMHWLRDQKRMPANGPTAQARAEELRSGDDLPGEVMERQESLQVALDALEERYKVPFLLVFLEGFTCQQAADFLEIPLGTVLSRIHRAKRFMREQLNQEQLERPHLRIYPERQEPDQPRASFGGA
jgi:RNA polymerase sigma-70 factor, ECF subfamily